MITEQGCSVPSLEYLGVIRIYCIEGKYRIEEKQAGAAISADERAELKTLRKEVKELRMEKEILKKASNDSIPHCSFHEMNRDLNLPMNNSYRQA